MANCIVLVYSFNIQQEETHIKLAQASPTTPQNHVIIVVSIKEVYD